MSGSKADGHRLPTGIALSLLWASLMGLYIYNDYISLYTPGVVADMMAGKMGPLGVVNDGIMIGVAVLMAVPALMIFLAAGLPRVISRWLNVVLGLVYTAVEVLTLSNSPPFYVLVVVLEILVTLTIVIYALRWSREPTAA